MEMNTQEAPKWEIKMIETFETDENGQNGFFEKEHQCFGFLGFRDYDATEDICMDCFHKSGHKKINGISVIHISTGLRCASFHILRRKDRKNAKKVVEKIHQLCDWDFGTFGDYNSVPKQYSENMREKINAILDNYKLEYSS